MTDPNVLRFEVALICLAAVLQLTVGLIRFHRVPLAVFYSYLSGAIFMAGLAWRDIVDNVQTAPIPAAPVLIGAAVLMDAALAWTITAELAARKRIRRHGRGKRAR